MTLQDTPGALSRIRTCDPLIRNQVRYPLRHQGMCRHGDHGDFTHLRFLEHPGKEVEAVVFTEIDIE